MLASRWRKRGEREQSRRMPRSGIRKDGDEPPRGGAGFRERSEVEFGHEVCEALDIWGVAGRKAGLEFRAEAALQRLTWELVVGRMMVPETLPHPRPQTL